MLKGGFLLLGAVSFLVFGQWVAGDPAVSSPAVATAIFPSTASPTASATLTPTPAATVGGSLSYIYLPDISNPPAVTVFPPGSDPFILAAGDIADCNYPSDYQTAALIEGYPQGQVLTLGDNAYQDGTALQFATCYDSAWGSFLSRTHPSVGNHDYLTTGAIGYYNYFGAAAGEPGQGYYSFDIGSWHLIALNSECAQVGGCGAGSTQELWLKNDLLDHPAQCTLAFWHRPLFASGKEGSAPEVQPLWQDLYAAGVDVVLNGHDHIYERYAPQDPFGNSDPVHGITEFVVGTGGYAHSPMQTILPNSVVHDNTTFGVLRITLHPGSYDWQFLPVPGGTFTDSGSAACSGG